MALDFFYDAQIRRYCLQFTRIFHGFQYEANLDNSGNRVLKTVPAVWASKDSQIYAILQNNSENTALSTPRITCDMVSMKMDPKRRQNPTHVDHVQIRERAIDTSVTPNVYTGNSGNLYTVDRYMAVPYNLTLRATIWSANEQQKHQIMEQILVLFNPAIDIQSDENAIDWASLTRVELTDIEWTNRTMPMSTTDVVELATLTFTTEIWISPPAKLKRQTIIQQIVTNIGNMAKEYNGEGQYGGYIYANGKLTQSIVTPENHQVYAEILTDVNNEKHVVLTLLNSSGGLYDLDNNVYNWWDLIIQYGTYSDDSEIWLKTNSDMDDHNSDIKGTFVYHPTEVNKIIVTPSFNSLPVSTLLPVDAIISNDNTPMYPGNGLLPAATIGQRYMTLSYIPVSVQWNGLNGAKPYDIIEYDGVTWNIVFDGDTVDSELVTNTKSGKQYIWKNNSWNETIVGDYLPGYWRLFL